MAIGIMGAMREEVDSILALMTNVSESEMGRGKYYVGKLNDVDVVLTFSGWGKVAAAITVTTLILKFDVKEFIFVGVAGAVSSNLSIGDIVVSDKLYQHDMNAVPLYPKHEIPLTGVTFFQADKALVMKATRACEGLLSKIAQEIPSASLLKFFIKAPKCIVGTIATGDEFIASSERTAAILQEQPEASAVEMEGAAVAQVCHAYNIPFVVIRTISDLANHGAPIDFPAFIQEVAREYSGHIVGNMCSI